MSIIVKASFNGDCRRIKVAKATPFDDLLGAAKAIFHGLGSGFSVKYNDDEGDLVTIASDAEFMEAAEMYQSKVLKLFLVAKAGKESAAVTDEEKKSTNNNVEAGGAGPLKKQANPSAEHSGNDDDYEFVEEPAKAAKDTKPAPKNGGGDAKHAPKKKVASEVAKGSPPNVVVKSPANVEVKAAAKETGPAKTKAVSKDSAPKKKAAPAKETAVPKKDTPKVKVVPAKEKASPAEKKAVPKKEPSKKKAVPAKEKASPVEKKAVSKEPAPKKKAAPALKEALDSPPDVKFVQDLNIPDGQRVQAGANLTKTWLLENNGADTWPAAFEMRYLAGTPSFAQTKVVKLSAVQPGKQAAVSVRLKAPAKAGKAHAAFGFFCRGKRFGHKVWVSVVVEGQNESKPEHKGKGPKNKPEHKGKWPKKNHQQEKEKKKPTPGPVHYGIECDASGMFPIVGNRYHKKGCDYDLCEAEYFKLPEEDRKAFVKIASPAKGGARLVDMIQKFVAPILSPKKANKEKKGKGEQKVLAVEFVRDVNLEDGSKVAAGQRLVKTWQLKNTGSAAWPAGAHVARLRGNWPHTGAEEQPRLGAVQPGETVEVSAHLTVPASGFGGGKLGGKLNAMFGLMLADGKTRVRGASFWIEVKVANAGQGVPCMKDLGELVSALFRDRKVVVALQKEFPRIVEAIVEDKKSLSEVVEKLMELHPCLASQPLLQMLEPYFPMIEVFFAAQAKAMWRLLRKQNAMLQRVRNKAERKAQRQLEGAKKEHAQALKANEKLQAKAKKALAKATETAAKKASTGGKKAEQPEKKKKKAAPKEEPLRCKFLSDVTILDNCKLVGGAKVVKIWKLKNAGKTAWPQGVALHKVMAGSNFACAAVLPVPDASLPAAGGEYTAKLSFTVPKEPGKYVATYRPAAKEGKTLKFFGQKIWVSFVVEGEEKPETGKKPEAGKKDVAGEKDEAKKAAESEPKKELGTEEDTEAKLKQLAAMGFKDRELNLYLLGVYGKDIKKVVSWLLNN